MTWLRCIASILLTITSLVLAQCTAFTPTVHTPTMSAPTITSTPIQTTPPPARPTPTLSPNIRMIERDVTYCTADGVALKMDLYFPKQTNGKAMPVLVNVHGGSWSSNDKTTSETMEDIPELVSRGYLVAAVDYRLAPKYKFPAQIEDVKCAVRYLRANASKLQIDFEHIGAWGCSAGGHLVSLLGLADPSAGFEGSGGYADQSSRVQAVAEISAPTDLTLYDLVTRGDMLERVFNVTSANDPMLTKASPISYVSPDDPPFLIVQAEKDNVIISQHAEELDQRLKQAGVPVQLIAVTNARHCLMPIAETMTPTRAQVTQTIADFFDRVLRR